MTNDIDLTSRGRVAALRHESNDRSAYDKNRVRLERLCSLAEAHHKNVLFVSLPTRPEYRINLNQQKVAGNKKVVRDLHNKHPNVAYLDFESDGRFDKSDFYDADHLNYAGAAKFSRILGGLLARSGTERSREYSQLSRKEDRKQARVLPGAPGRGPGRPS